MGTTPARESDSEVKIVKTPGARDVFGGWKSVLRGRRREFDSLQTWRTIRLLKTGPNPERTRKRFFTPNWFFHDQTFFTLKNSRFSCPIAFFVSNGAFFVPNSALFRGHIFFRSHFFFSRPNAANGFRLTFSKPNGPPGNTWQAQEFVRVAKTLAGVVDLKRVWNDAFRVAGAGILWFVMSMFEAFDAESVEGLQI